MSSWRQVQSVAAAKLSTALRLSPMSAYAIGQRVDGVGDFSIV